jgi:hypothetical protein
VISKECGFDGQSHSCILLMLPHQGQYTDRPNWPRPAGRLRSGHDYQGPHKPSDLDHILTGRFSSVDEPGTYRPATVRITAESPNGILGLLCAWNGYIRNDQRERAIPRRRRPDGCREGGARETSPSRREVQEEFVGNVGTVLGVSAEQPPEHRRCSSVFGGVLEFVVTTFRLGHLLLWWTKGQTNCSSRRNWLGGEEIYVGAILFVPKPL